MRGKLDDLDHPENFDKMMILIPCHSVGYLWGLALPVLDSYPSEPPRGVMKMENGNHVKLETPIEVGSRTMGWCSGNTFGKFGSAAHPSLCYAFK